MINWTITTGILLFIIGFGVYGGCNGGSGTSGVVILDPQVVRMTFSGQESEVAFITIPFLKNSSEGLITNAAVDFNGDGMFASYDINGDVQEEWIVQNALLLISDTEYTVYFTAVDPDIMPGDEVDVRVTVGETEVEAPWDGMIAEGASSLDIVVTIKSLDVENLVDPAPGAIGGGGLFSVAQAQDGNGLGTPEDEITEGPGGDGEAFMRQGLPDVMQGFNTCVAHSVANSLSWLARICGFTEKFQEDLTTLEGINDIAISVLDAYDEVNGFLIVGGQFRGVSNDKLLEGKENFTTGLDLPITSILLSRADGELRFDDIKQAMNDGCDVELILTMLDVDTGSPLLLGHAVTLAGYSESSSGKSFIVHDPGTTTFNDSHQLSESQMGGLTFPYSFMGNTKTALVDFILIECCTATAEPPGVIPPLIPEPTPEPQMASFNVSPDGPIEFTHTRTVTPCPQEIAILDITNTGPQKTQFVVQSNSIFIDFRLEGEGPPSLSQLSFELEPGESRMIVVFFNCETPQSFEANIFIDGVLVDNAIGAIPGTGATETIPISATIQ